jgi:hypothetical protein
MPPGGEQVDEPMNAAQLYDLGPNVRINVVCRLCKRGNSMPADFVIRLGIKSSTKVLDLVATSGARVAVGEDARRSLAA